MHLYYGHTLYSFPLYIFLRPEDDPQWPKHVVVSVINRIQDSCVLSYPTPYIRYLGLSEKGYKRNDIMYTQHHILSCDQINNKMGWACSTCGKQVGAYRVRVGRPDGKKTHSEQA